MAHFDDTTLLFQLIKNSLFLNALHPILISFVEWQGQNCTEDVDECSSSSPPCHPDHTYNCTNVQGDYICYCHPGFSNKNCFTNINECSSVTCHNGGTCIDGINSYTCNCTSGKSWPRTHLYRFANKRTTYSYIWGGGRFLHAFFSRKHKTVA